MAMRNPHFIAAEPSWTMGTLICALAEKRFLTGTEPARTAAEIAKALNNIPVPLTTWTRCGKPHCRCSASYLNGPYHALHWREGNVQRRRYVRADDVPAVRAILETRRDQRRVERLALTLSLRSWRELGEWIAEYEARLRAERERL